MSIRLSDDEAWAELAAAHTGVYVTLRRDGWPVPLPVWFAALDRHIYVRTPARSKKITRVRRDPRGSFLVERGLRWVELCAVVIPVESHVLEPGDESERAADALTAKYRQFQSAPAATPEATRRAYSNMTMVRLDQVGPAVTWDNSRIRMVGSEG